MRLVVIFTLALSIHLLHAQTLKTADNQATQAEESFVEKMRPKLMEFLGEEWTVKLIGKAPVAPQEEVALPFIPNVNDDAKSTAVYNKKEDAVVLAPELEQKFRYAYIREVFESTRQTKPTDEEVTIYMNVLSQGGTREGVYRALVLDSVYGGMENWDKAVKSTTADFAVEFYRKYLGKKVVKKSFEGMNVFTLKRLITENTLEVADALENDRDSLERWYAVMSAELATKFPQIWSNEMRKKTSSLTHKAWAEKVPVQHIKSELIIKIHSAFNSMI